jgi:hypothetical protein
MPVLLSQRRPNFALSLSVRECVYRLRCKRAAAFEEALAMLPANRMPDLTELTVAMNFASAPR